MSAFKTRFAEWEEWLEEEDDEELQHELLVVPPAPECEATTRWLKDGDRAAELAMDAPVVGPVLQADAFLALLLADFEHVSRF